MSSTDDSKQTVEIITRFNRALMQRDFDALRDSMTEDCIFEDTDPRPDGQRFVGRDAIVQYFKLMVEISPQSVFEVEEMIACGDRCTVLWNHRWVRQAVEGNNRGVDVFKVRDGKLAEKLSYTKNG